MRTPTIDRRRFLGLTGGTAAGLLAGLVAPSRAGALASRAARAGAQPAFGEPAARTLVVVDLEGGNDALNTLVPAVGAYHDLRPTIGLGDDELLSFDGLDYGVNPSLAPWEPLWQRGHIAAVYGAGLPEQSRSHFVAQDAWRSAQPGRPATSGWLGRWLEATAPPVEVPLRAIALGRSTLAAEGEQGRPVAVQSVEGYRLAPPRGNAAVTDAVLAMATPIGTGLFGQAQQAIPATVESVELLQGLIAGAADSATEFGPDPTSSLFAAAQAIIQADLGTQVLYITVPGFDTHASQRTLQDQLLATVAGGVAQMLENLETTGDGHRTLVLTVSEFGRRAAENASDGTDHGNGGLAFVVGAAVGGSRVIGGADLADLDRGDLPMVVDTRSIYDEALRWLGADDDLARTVIDGDRASLELLSAV